LIRYQIEFAAIWLETNAEPKMYAENFTCFSQNEIQGAHWMRNSVTVHPTILNYNSPECPDSIVEECVDIISDDLVHDAHAFQHFLQVIHQHLTTTQPVSHSG
jgi:hypothetical protein